MDFTINAKTSIARFYELIWPQVPIGLFIVAAGIINVLAGLNAEEFLEAVTGELTNFQEQVSLGSLGHGAQVILGLGLILTGIGLFWRMRVAWTFAALMLLITIAVNVAGGHLGVSLVIPVAVLVLLIATHRHFSRRTLLGSSFISLVAVCVVVAYGTLGIYLLGQQFDPKIKDVFTALYFLIETLSTTGYGDYHPVTQMAQGFMITVWVFGLGVFGATLASTAGPLLSGHLSNLLNPGDSIKMHKNHVILIGKGAFVANTVEELKRRKIDFVQILPSDRDQSPKDYSVVYGDTSDDQTLIKACIKDARLLVAADNDDGENAFNTLAAKDMNNDIQVLAVASSKHSIRRLKLAGADTVFAPAQIGGQMIVSLVAGDQMPDQFSDLIK